MHRRNFIWTLAATAFASAFAQVPSTLSIARKGRLKQAITRGVFARSMSMEDMCREAARLGIKGFDLIGPADWPTLKKYGLVPSMYPGGPGGSIASALNRKDNHERLLGLMNAAIDEAAGAGVPN